MTNPSSPPPKRKPPAARRVAGKSAAAAAEKASAPAAEPGLVDQVRAMARKSSVVNPKMSFSAYPSAYIDDNCQIGDGTKIWHFCHIMPGCEIGENCNIGQNVVVSPKVKLGKNVRVQNNVSIYEGVICEDDVFLGPSMVSTNVINPRSAVSRKHEYLPTLVKRGASIGANATIVCGNEIGEYAFIGAGAVVTKPVRAYALIIGNPGRQTGWMSEYGYKLVFDASVPTGGSARWSGPLGVHDFLKKMAVVNLPEDDMEELNQYAGIIARAEGLTGHAHAVERRLQGR